MIDNLLTATTCRVTSGDAFGTGFLVARGVVLTARHCVLPGIESGLAIEVKFNQPGGEVAVPSIVVAQSEELDACLLGFEQSFDAKPIPLSTGTPREGSEWRSFGYPTGKFELGHRVTGIIDQVLASPKARVDLDVQVDGHTVIPDYRGHSGGPVVVEGVVVAMLRYKFGRSLGGISVRALEEFLAAHGHAPPKPQAKPDAPDIADRQAFQTSFEKHLKANAGEYVFLEGGHGLGKTTFCNTYKPTDQDLQMAGAYCIFLPGSALSSIHRAQPEVFFDWLLTTVIDLITGKGARKEKRTYKEMGAEVVNLLQAVSEYVAARNKRAVIFIDGLNEAQDAGPELLAGLVGLLPAKLPAGVTIVLTAPNYSLLAPQLAGRVKEGNVRLLPPLTEAASLRYCQRKLTPDRAKPELTKGICERAAGHPLYLHYIIEHVNLQPEGSDLVDFPVLTGPIEQYYRVIWEKVALNGEIVRLLALAARLRWGIDVGLFTKALSAAEQVAAPAVLRQIRHLLVNEATTAIYHQSFAAYIVGQTLPAEEAAHHQIAELCRKEAAEPYCQLNRVYHLSRAMAEDRKAAIRACDQAWADQAARLAAEPDAVLADIDKVMDLVMASGPAVDFFRLLLLAQRVQFRYNVLFAQSAALIAEALIALGRPDEALTYLIRFKSLIIDASEALVLAHRFIQDGYPDHAIQLLGRLEDRLVELYHERVQLHDFLRFCSWHIQAIFLGRLADGPSGVKGYMKVSRLAERACSQDFKDQPQMMDSLMSPILCLSNSYFLTFRDRYPSLAEIKPQLKGEPPPARLLLMLCNAILHFETWVDRYNLGKSRESLPVKFKDMEELIDLGYKVEERLVVVVVDTLVRFNAPVSLVRRIAAQGKPFEDRAIALLDKNGVDVDFTALSEDMNRLRTNAFLNETEPPAAGNFGEDDWLASLHALARALYCCDGRARRAKSDGDAKALAAIYEKLWAHVLTPLFPPLAQRADWANAYAIPEQLLPNLHRQVIELLVDCFPAQLPAYLERLLGAAPDQWGLYTEGFREALYRVLRELARNTHPAGIGSLALKLLDVWRNHVLRGVENRRELVPELLRLIPLHMHFGAQEEAARLYDQVLAVSMGPSWYKEDQLGLMTTVLAQMPATDDVGADLPLVAGYLERAAGEMTFQRYVRHEKGVLGGEIVRRGRYAGGLAYYRRQTCGTNAELMAEAHSGFIDKPAPDRGQRFPGGALEEQASILQIVRNAQAADWRIRWALLEIFLCGDSRHVDDYAEEFAGLANEAGADTANLPLVEHRLAVALRAETARDLQGEFSRAFREILKPGLRAHFVHLVGEARPPGEGINGAGKGTPPAPSQTSDPGESDAEMERRDKDFFMPGVFGRHAPMRDSKARMAKAEAAMAAGNREAAKEEAAALLASLQKGEWDIWSNRVSEEHRRAGAMLREGETSAEALVRRYAPMVKAEKNTPPWAVAEHLIGKITGVMPEVDRRRLLAEVIEHIRVMTGPANDEIKAFEFLASPESPEHADHELIRFLAWLVEHPVALRRQRAAVLLAWLFSNLASVAAVVTPLAFSNAPGYGAEVLATILDHASAKEPVRTWDRLVPHLNPAWATGMSAHAGRLETLRRIAARAGAAGSDSAQSFVGQIDDRLAKRTFTETSGPSVPLPAWAGRLAGKWHALAPLGLGSNEVRSALTRELGKICAPFTIEESWRLESAVSEGFREEPDQPLGRWEGRLHTALNLALDAFMPVHQRSAVEVILRVCNPSLPDDFIEPGEHAFFVRLMDAMRKPDFTGVFVQDGLTALHLRAAFLGNDDGIHSVEVLAVVVAGNQRQRAMFPPKLTSPFPASETPGPAADGGPQETCLRARPGSLFFGAFTPAVPLPAFANTIGAGRSDFIRKTWCYSRQHQLKVFGKVIQEGCGLMVKMEACKLPPGKKLAWLVWVGGQLRGMVDDENNFLL